MIVHNATRAAAYGLGAQRGVAAREQTKWVPVAIGFGVLALVGGAVLFLALRKRKG